MTNNEFLTMMLSRQQPIFGEEGCRLLRQSVVAVAGLGAFGFQMIFGSGEQVGRRWRVLLGATAVLTLLCAAGAVLAGDGFCFTLAFESTHPAFQEQVGSFTTGELALGSEISSHDLTIRHTRRFLGGRQPLWGIGVTSFIIRTVNPAA